MWYYTNACTSDTFASFWSIQIKNNWFCDTRKQRPILNKDHLYLRSRIWQCVKCKCGNKWYLVVMRPICHLPRKVGYKVCVDLVEMVLCPVGTEEKAGILPHLHSLWERWHFWNIFLLIGNWAYHGTCVDSEWYTENRHKEE